MTKWFYSAIVMVLFALAGCSQSATPMRSDVQDFDEPTPTVELVPEQETPINLSTQNATEGFAIYLVQQEGDAVQDMEEVGLNELPLEESPILSIDDITKYTWETHEIELTETAYARFARLHRKVPVYPGLPFAVCVGSERIYRGAFWTAYSSVPFDGIVIDIYPAESSSPLRIETGYPSKEWFEGEDLRFDPRIFRSLEEANKLK
jgi:hypothetical protein